VILTCASASGIICIGIRKGPEHLELKNVFVHEGKSIEMTFALEFKYVNR